MTERLYFTDSQLVEFESDVARCTAAGERYEVVLAATAFYPTGGGQPHDVGTLANRAVLDVVDRDADGIVHVVDGPIDPGTRAKGIVDWKRRLDHMQQHSGQHILSAAFESLFAARTESFHMGSTTSTIDLHRGVSPADIAAAEDEANRVVFRATEVRVRFASPDETGSLPLRKEPGREGILRLIEVPGFDLSACGGTHVKNTGTVGVVAITGWEKFKGGTRVEFVCGGRAVGRIRSWRDTFSATSRILSVVPAELPAAIERLQDDNKSLGRTAREQQERLAALEAAKLVDAARRPDGSALVVTAVDGFDAAGLKALAAAAIAHPGVRAAFLSNSNPALVVVGRAAGVPVDAAAILKALIARFGGKGGGRPELAQGGGLVAPTDQIVAAARDLLGAESPTSG